MNSLFAAAILAFQETAPTTETGSNQDGGPGSLFSFTPFIIILGIFYFLMIRPEKKQRAQHEEMLQGLKKGDKVVTTGGMYGAVVQVQNDIVTLQIAENTRVRFNIRSVQSLQEDPKQEAKDEPKKELEAKTS